MTDWIDTEDGYRVKTVQVGDVTVVLRRPTTLTDKERTKREHAVEHALANLARKTKHT